MAFGGIWQANCGASSLPERRERVGEPLKTGAPRKKMPEFDARLLPGTKIHAT